MPTRRHSDEHARPGETEAERLDRNYEELLQEMRVLQAGVQILLAFLLTIPFQASFTDLADYQRAIYALTVMTAALATVCIIGPVPFHRVVFRRGMKDDLITFASRMVSVGLGLLAVAIVGTVLPVFDVIWDIAVASALAGSLGVAFVTVWGLLPLRVLRREQG